jgi:hypothetical protein
MDGKEVIDQAESPNKIQFNPQGVGFDIGAGNSLFITTSLAINF